MVPATLTLTLALCQFSAASEGTLRSVGKEGFLFSWLPVLLPVLAFPSLLLAGASVDLKSRGGRGEDVARIRPRI